MTTARQAGPSILGRALVAIGLLIGFYVLAIAVIVLLVYLPYAEYRYLGRLHIRLALGCGLGALAVLVGMIPRRDRFEPPGPRLSRRDHPELFAMIDDVAERTGQELPREVYAELAVNAWVAERGGVMGAGSRRVMCLGLPLLRALTVSEVRAVLAHEFGHFHGGDTRLGTWIYKTRSAIGNTLSSLSDSVLQVVFHAYGKLFLRVTQSISRRQEYEADRLAAEVVGAQHLASGLRKVHGAAVSFGVYLESEIGPVIQNGRLPPLSDGFALFLRSERIAGLVRDEIQRELRAPREDAYDSHPPLAHRVAALRALPAGDAPADDRPAVALLNDVPGLEQELIRFAMGPRRAAELQPIPWDRVVDEVYARSWREVRDRAREALAPYVAEDPPLRKAELKELGKRAIAPKIAPSPDAAVAYAVNVVECALAMALVERGLRPETAVGGAIRFTHDGRTIEPFGTIRRLMDGELSAGAWRETCTALGIRGRSLGG